MNNKKQDKKKASINPRKLNVDEQKSIKKKNNKIILDSEDELEEENPEGKEKKRYIYPKDDNNYDSLSTDKSEDIYSYVRKRREKGANSVKKKKLKKNKNKERQSLTVTKEKTKKKEKEKFIEDNNEFSYNKNGKKRTSIKNKVDIEMRDDTQMNKNRFTISSLKDNYLPCREEEQEYIYNYIKQGLDTNGNYSSLYIAGMPGTGKTACVNNVINVLEKDLNGSELSFKTLFLCGTEYIQIAKIYKTIYDFIFVPRTNRKGRKRRKNYIQKLDEFFKNRNDFNSSLKLKDPTNSHIIFVVDEIDFLINKNQNCLYNLFNWTTYEYSKLIIISISNTLDLPEHLLPKIKSRMGNNKLMFKAYNKDQLIEIIKSKDIDYEKFSEDSIKLSCMKVSAVNGDLRRTIQILLRAKELFNLEHTKQSTFRKIGKNFIIQACDDLFNSKLRKAIQSLQICEKIILCAILSKIKDTDNSKINLGQLYDKIDIFINKYNEKLKIERRKIDLYWEEFKTIIYNLIRLNILTFADKEVQNFKENTITVKFYIDEFIVACDGDVDLKPVLDFLMNLISI